MRLEHHSYPAKLEFQRDGGVGRRVIGLDSAESEGNWGRLLNAWTCRYRLIIKMSHMAISISGGEGEWNQRLIGDTGRHRSELVPSNQSPCPYSLHGYFPSQPTTATCQVRNSRTRSYMIVFTFLISISTASAFKAMHTERQGWWRYR